MEYQLADCPYVMEIEYLKIQTLVHSNTRLATWTIRILHRHRLL